MNVWDNSSNYDDAACKFSWWVHFLFSLLLCFMFTENHLRAIFLCAWWEFFFMSLRLKSEELMRKTRSIMSLCRKTRSKCSFCRKTGSNNFHSDKTCSKMSLYRKTRSKCPFCRKTDSKYPFVEKRAQQLSQRQNMLKNVSL